MIPAIIVGVVLGGGVLLLARGILAPAPKLSDLADDTYRSQLRASSEGVGAGFRARLLRLVPPDQYTAGPVATAMRVTRTSPEKHIIDKFTLAAGAFFFPIVAWVIATAAGFEVSVLLPFAAALPLGVLGFLFPDVAVKDQAKEKREEFRSAFASFLNLASILVGASGGPESALERAAKSGSGWVFMEIQAALERSRGDANLKHWDALAQLGEELDIRELREFANAMNANATSSSLSETLRSRADNLRDKVNAAIEGDAETATDRMNLPVSLLTMGLMIFILYAALFSTLGSDDTLDITAIGINPITATGNLLVSGFSSHMEPFGTPL